MAKSLYIAEKPSVAQEFAKALGLAMKRFDGYQESDEAVVTWCVGHLVTMSYPEAYDKKYKKWSLSTLPFIPKEFKYEVIPGSAKQFNIVSRLLNRADISRIYVCTDSGREGEYIYRLVEQMAGVRGKERRRVWIDSQTKEEILRGIREAKDLSEYDNLSASAYLRAKEDYLMGINFSRLLTLRYGGVVADYLHERYAVISVGRVMTCVLGMAVRREREIRSFEKTSFFRLIGTFSAGGMPVKCEWRATGTSAYYGSPKLYKENGFKERADAQSLADSLADPPEDGVLASIEKKKEARNAPLLFNLAELQNTCSKFFKISPDETLKIAQELYEKKLVTYPRTDARVLSSAVAKEIDKNIEGLKNIQGVSAFAEEILERGSYKNISRTRYTNDKQITDHYALIPTGQGIGALRSLGALQLKVYETIVRRFLSIFYPPAAYQKISLEVKVGRESFFAGFKALSDPGYLKVMEYSFFKDRKKEEKDDDGPDSDMEVSDAALLGALSAFKKGERLRAIGYEVKEGETSPPKRYTSGSMVLAMENAGQLIEDEELRAQIKGSGIGTSATRAEIIAKLVKNKYLSLNKKTQVLTPTLMGEMVYDVVYASIKSLLNPELTASWEKGLSYVADGKITPDEYMRKLENFIRSHTDAVLRTDNGYLLRGRFDAAAAYYKKNAATSPKNRRKKP